MYIILINIFIFKIFENCFIESLDEILSVATFQNKFETPWRKLIQYIFKQYTDGMNLEEINHLEPTGNNSLTIQNII